MSRHATTRTVAAALLGLALGLADTASATYVIITKDGKRIEARDKPVVQGKRLVYLNPLGTPQSIAFDEWDQERSEKANKEGLGNAYLLDDPSSSRSSLPEPAAKKPSLSDYIRQHGRKMDASRPEVPDGELVKVRPPEGESRPAGREAASEPTTIVMDPQITQAFMRALDGSSIKGVRLIQIPSGVRVQATTESEQQVLLGLVACARGLKESRAAGKPLDRAEIVFATSSGESAARFELSPNDAETLLNGRVTPARFFVSNVIF
ncbi:MAG: hypothetical protein WCC53_09365 [Thermoanaerobaculia bacterium]